MKRRSLSHRSKPLLRKVCLFLKAFIIELDILCEIDLNLLMQKRRLEFSY